MELWELLEETFQDQKRKVEELTAWDLEYIPDEKDMKVEVGKWYKIRNVVSLYIDMKGSTELTNEKYVKTSAKMYEIFTGALIKILKQQEFKAHFIDIKGDGGFALWKEKYGSVKALLAAVTFKTFVEKYLKSYVRNQITDWDIASKTGIAKGIVLVKRVGERGYNWPVWAGRPVNISAKLSDKAEKDTILVTDEVFQDFSVPKELCEYLILSCGCDGKGNFVGKKDLWIEKTEYESEFPTKVWELRSRWCDIHGEDYINKVIEIISKE